MRQLHSRRAGGPFAPPKEDDGLWVAEDRSPIPGAADEEPDLATRTLGEIYLRQGLFERAEEVFLELLEEDPGDQELLDQLEEARAGKRREGPVAEAVHQELAPESIVPIESLAPDVIVPIESLAPDAVEERTPDLIVPIESWAPEVVEALPVEELAPDVVDAFPVEELAPDVVEVFPEEEPAPELIVSIESLAPDVVDAVPVEDLAPEAESPEDDPTLDDFQNWLDKLQ